jgi:hypothetical protein
MGLRLDKAAQKVEDRVVGENEERDQKEGKNSKFGPNPRARSVRPQCMEGPTSGA